MFKKTITYTDFNDEERTETFYFNLTKTELAKLEYSKGGGLTEWIRRAVEKKDGKSILETFDEILKATYGVKTPDGTGFMKSEASFEAFKATNAYDILFMELVTDADAAAQFIIECMPKDVQTKAREEMSKQKNNIDDASTIKKVES